MGSAGSARRQGGIAQKRWTFSFCSLLGLVALLICALIVALTFIYFDVPIALRVDGMLGAKQHLESGFASAVLLGMEAAVALALVIARILRGRLPPAYEVTALACVTSICAYAINDGLLKFMFGVPDPEAVLHGARHAFALLSGTSNSSFPSGHMALAGAFAGVFMRLYRTSILPLSALLLIGAGLLIVGDWHFVSDVIAGTFVGISAGLMAGEVWLAHARRRGEPGAVLASTAITRAGGPPTQP